MTDDTTMDATDDERQRAQARHVDPLAEWLAEAEELWEKTDDPREIHAMYATEVRAFLAERVTVERIAVALEAEDTRFDTEALPAGGYWHGLSSAVLALLRREVGPR